MKNSLITAVCATYISTALIYFGLDVFYILFLVSSFSVSVVISFLIFRLSANFIETTIRLSVIMMFLHISCRIIIQGVYSVSPFVDTKFQSISIEVVAFSQAAIFFIVSILILIFGFVYKSIKQHKSGS